ncbi:hypothetical protein QTH90_14640 [Variovorax sp. J2P1-59]|uniref:hypothetical protein n=1 Tax=Variovorax flavidus TaxID=3053501 RepID=UPI002578F963|nr:hypothetical protein [Variovorax sp. J2P1-59]MDM0075638.1 hypothetical protein [Variovorax sp. J2P1-59]
MTLKYLDFDYSEDSEGIGVFDAMATTGPQHVAAVHAEIGQVLEWAHAAFAGRRGPVGDGGDWDYDLQGMQEIAVPETIEFDEETLRVRVRTSPPATPRHTVTLSISGTPEFCVAFTAEFDLG